MVMMMVVMRMLARALAQERSPAHQHKGEKDEGPRQDKGLPGPTARAGKERMGLAEVELGKKEVGAGHSWLPLRGGGGLLYRFGVAGDGQALHPVTQRMAANLQAFGGFCQVEVILLKQRRDQFPLVAGHDLIQ
jgi:hypothetical protein